MMNYFKFLYILILICTAFSACTEKLVDQNIYEIVIQNRRVINPANQTDKILNIAIRADTIVAISPQKLQGKLVIDATNLIIAPGFIDIHSHTPTPLGQYFQLKGGVTTALVLLKK